MAIRITKSLVESLGSSGSIGTILWDCDLRGFGVRPNKNGSVTYLVQYRLGGRGNRSRRIAIGHHGSPWTTAEARAEARRLLGLVATGTDPAAVADNPAPDIYSVATAAEDFSRLYLRTHWQRTHRDAERVMETMVVPAIGDRDVRSVSRRDINAILDQFVDRPARLKYCHSVIRKFFYWLLDREAIDKSPLAGAKAPRAVPARARVLSPREVWAIWQASLDMPYPFGPFTRILLATAQRRSEVAGMDWQELSDPDEHGSFWCIPGSRMKMGLDHLVPLSPLLVSELRTLSNHRSGLLFSTTGVTPISGFSKARNQLHAAAEAKLGEPIPHFRWHDLRRTASTGMQTCGVLVEVTERVMAHVSGKVSGVAAVYNLYDYLDEKEYALNCWGACLSWIANQPDPLRLPTMWKSSWLLANSVIPRGAAADSGTDWRAAASLPAGSQSSDDSNPEPVAL